MSLSCFGEPTFGDSCFPTLIAIPYFPPAPFLGPTFLSLFFLGPVISSSELVQERSCRLCTWGVSYFLTKERNSICILRKDIMLSSRLTLLAFLKCCPMVFALSLKILSYQKKLISHMMGYVSTLSTIQTIKANPPMWQATVKMEWFGLVNSKIGCTVSAM